MSLSPTSPLCPLQPHVPTPPRHPKHPPCPHISDVSHVSCIPSAPLLSPKCPSDPQCRCPAMAQCPPCFLCPPPPLLCPHIFWCVQAFWQSSAFVLGAAVEQFYGATICSTVATEDGFFCDAHMGDRYRAVGTLPRGAPRPHPQRVPVPAGRCSAVSCRCWRMPAWPSPVPSTALSALRPPVRSCWSSSR